MSIVNNKCGSCSLCCKLPALPELDKPRDRWCAHAGVGVCAIYSARPQGCRDFVCMWLASQETEQPMSEELRPDRSHVILRPNINDGVSIIAHVAEGRLIKPCSAIAMFVQKMGRPVFTVMGDTMVGPDGKGYHILPNGRVVDLMTMSEVAARAPKPGDVGGTIDLGRAKDE